MDSAGNKPRNEAEYHRDDVRRAVEALAFSSGAETKNMDSDKALRQGTPNSIGGLTVPRADSACRKLSDMAASDLLVECARSVVAAQLSVGNDKGKRGWHDPCQCNTHVLVAQLEHATQKKDWASVATYAIMLHVRAVNHWN